MASQKGLGKGLGALLGDFSDETAEKSPYQLLPIYKVEPNRSQPRQDFGEGELQSLAESISVHGIIQLNRCLSQQDVTDGTANKVGLHDDIMP